MLKVIEKCPPALVETYDSLTLVYDQRTRGRFRITSDKGREVGVFLPRGQALKHGDLLRTECGKLILVQARPEPVVMASCDDWQTFARACYHLGNRHVPLQVGDRWLRFQPDHVLQEMVELLGLTSSLETLSFTPEEGAYAAAGHSHGHHGHNHSNSHGHDHSHDHGDDHEHPHTHSHHGHHH